MPHLGGWDGGGTEMTKIYLFNGKSSTKTNDGANTEALEEKCINLKFFKKFQEM